MTPTASYPSPIVDVPNFDGIPDELKQLAQWVFWFYRLRADKSTGVMKWTKVPFGAGSQREPKEARANDSKTWLPFQVAKDWYIKYRDTDWGNDGGIGFEFHPDGPHFGIDLDDCRNPETEAIEPKAMEIIQRFGTYTEVSPSKTGVKLIGKGRLNLVRADGKPGTGKRRKIVWSDGHAGEIECYDRGRYFALTGNVLMGGDS